VLSSSDRRGPICCSSRLRSAMRRSANSLFVGVMLSRMLLAFRSISPLSAVRRASSAAASFRPSEASACSTARRALRRRA
jgi:hypothetical protein